MDECEPLMQGGIHPSFTGDSYLELLAAAKAAGAYTCPLFSST